MASHSVKYRRWAILLCVTAISVILAILVFQPAIPSNRILAVAASTSMVSPTSGPVANASGTPLLEPMNTAWEVTQAAAMTRTIGAWYATQLSAGGGSNQWTPQYQSFEGVEMVLVPQGCFIMGTANIRDRDAVPPTQICFDKPFWIDRTEVTQIQFESLGGTLADVDDYQFADMDFGDNLPMTHVTWFEAHDFCRKRGSRLPTEAEWEYAARGPADLLYPWGNTWDENKAFGKRDILQGPGEVGNNPGDISWVGALDLAGNVLEWTNSLYRPYPYNPNDGRESETGTTEYHVLRGGSWDFTSSESFQTFIRWSMYYRGSTGFRCVCSFDSAHLTASPIPATPRPLIPTVTPTHAQWTPHIQSFNGVDMVLVPAGCFMMGTAFIKDESPRTRICFDKPFWIDRTEMTQAQFRATGRKALWEPNFVGDDFPIENISWFEAKDACALRGARLPTEAEWEYAARGLDNWMYPWGNIWDPDKVGGVNGAEVQAVKAGSHPGDISWVGALDLAGSVPEWTSSLYRPYPYNPNDGREDNIRGKNRVVRGAEQMRMFYRVWSFPSSRGWTGARCARSFESVTPTATPKSAVPKVTANAQWTPRYQRFGGVEMALVPPGCFEMGTNNPPPEPEYMDFSNEKPSTKICFDQPFWIDRTEVTQAQFKAAGFKLELQRFIGDNLPMQSVTWFEARDFCVKRGGRLPTEAEWEYAARGPDNWIYPWGNTWDEKKAVWGRDQGPAAVGSLPSGMSWVGALDLIGNVEEWTYSLDEPYPYNSRDGRENFEDDDIFSHVGIIYRGGDWMTDQSHYDWWDWLTGKSYNPDEVKLQLRATVRGRTTADAGLGFRCMRNSPPK